MNLGIHRHFSYRATVYQFIKSYAQATSFCLGWRSSSYDFFLLPFSPHKRKILNFLKARGQNTGLPAFHPKFSHLAWSICFSFILLIPNLPIDLNRSKVDQDHCFEYQIRSV